jgi:hypothetical protein
MMNIYGKEASAYYDLFSGLRHLARGEARARPIATEANDMKSQGIALCARGPRPATVRQRRRSDTMGLAVMVSLMLS